MEEISTFFYMTRKDLEEAIRQWLTKEGHGRKLSGLKLSPNDSEWVDGWFQAVFSNGKMLAVEEYDES